jgi:hypothetical protein
LDSGNGAFPLEISMGLYTRPLFPLENIDLNTSKTVQNWTVEMKVKKISKKINVKNVNYVKNVIYVNYVNYVFVGQVALNRIIGLY